jgi:endonuclease YncB( thermonuclease family)
MTFPLRRKIPRPALLKLTAFSLALPGLAVLAIAPPAQAVTCASFQTQEQAQAYLERHGATNLDGDRDGIACEALPRKAQSPRSLTPNPQSRSAQTQSARYTVLSVGDGDTLRVTPLGQQKALSVRLACIDAPEMGQGVYGPQAAQRLKQLLPVGQTVQLRVGDRDRYGREVAEVQHNGRNINVQMVAEGQAVVYRRYLATCTTTTQQQLLDAERDAQQKRLGFWQQSNPMLPEVYRRRG